MRPLKYWPAEQVHWVALKAAGRLAGKGQVKLFPPPEMATIDAEEVANVAASDPVKLLLLRTRVSSVGSAKTVGGSEPVSALKARLSWTRG